MAPVDPRQAPAPAPLTRQEELAWSEDSVPLDSMDKPISGPDAPRFWIARALVPQPESWEGHTPARHTRPLAATTTVPLGSTEAPQILSLCTARRAQNPDLSLGSLQTLPVSRYRLRKMLKAVALMVYNPSVH